MSRLSRSQRIEFVHTGPAAGLFPGFPDDSPARAARWLAQAKAGVEALVRQHFRGPPTCRVKVQVLGGAGFHDLLDPPRRGDTDLIRVGKSESNGPFVEKLARQAPCSVLIVPSSRSVAYRHILVTTDFSEPFLQGAFVPFVAFCRKPPMASSRARVDNPLQPLSGDSVVLRRGYGGRGGGVRGDGEG